MEINSSLQSLIDQSLTQVVCDIGKLSDEELAIAFLSINKDAKHVFLKNMDIETLKKDALNYTSRHSLAAIITEMISRCQRSKQYSDMLHKKIVKATVVTVAPNEIKFDKETVAIKQGYVELAEVQESERLLERMVNCGIMLSKPEKQGSKVVPVCSDAKGYFFPTVNPFALPQISACYTTPDVNVIRNNILSALDKPEKQSTVKKLITMTTVVNAPMLSVLGVDPKTATQKDRIKLSVLTACKLSPDAQAKIARDYQLRAAVNYARAPMYRPKTIKEIPIMHSYINAMRGVRGTNSNIGILTEPYIYGDLPHAITRQLEAAQDIYNIIKLSKASGVKYNQNSVFKSAWEVLALNTRVYDLNMPEYFSGPTGRANPQIQPSFPQRSEDEVVPVELVLKEQELLRINAELDYRMALTIFDIDLKLSMNGAGIVRPAEDVAAKVRLIQNYFDRSEGPVAFRVDIWDDYFFHFPDKVYYTGTPEKMKMWLVHGITSEITKAHVIERAITANYMKTFYQFARTQFFWADKTYHYYPLVLKRGKKIIRDLDNFMDETGELIFDGPSGDMNMAEDEEALFARLEEEERAIYDKRSKVEVPASLPQVIVNPCQSWMNMAMGEQEPLPVIPQDEQSYDNGLLGVLKGDNEDGDGGW